MSIAEAGRQIRAARLAPVDLVDECLRRIRALEDQVRAWVVVDERGSLDAARRLGQEAAQGHYRSPLHGIPLGIKDIIDVEGFPTRAGSPLREHHRAVSDAPLVAALRQAGAIILGKTVTVQFACFDPPPTRNPWDATLRHTPGGSSSGSAVAVALGMCLGAIGTQTGGSLVRPASYCGIAAMKPTFGRVAIEGIVPVSYHLDHPGPMARTAEDLALLLSCLPCPSRFGGHRPSEQTPRNDGAMPSQPPRLGLVNEFFLEESDDAIRHATAEAIDKLHRSGAAIEPVTLPTGFADILPLHRRIMAVEAAAYHRESFAAHRSSYGPMITELLDEGLKIQAVDYAGALAHQRAWQARADDLVDGFDALVMPSTDTTAPATLSTTGPNRNQAPWSYLGLPAVTIPCGLASDGMPAGLQLVGRHDRDATLLAVARWCEEQLHFNATAPLLGP